MPNPMDQVISKGAGLAHEMKARMNGLVGVFKALAEQHGEAGALLKRAKADEKKRADLWPTIRAALKSHEQGELQEVYSAMREYAALRDLADRHESQAHQLSQTVDQMNALDPRSMQFGSLLDKLIGLVEAHVADEENQIFPKAQEVMGEARAKELEPLFLRTAKQIEETEQRRTQH